MSEVQPSEKWVPCPGRPCYEVSDRGQVKRVAAAQSTRAGRILKPTFNSYTGYLSVMLSRESKTCRRAVHVLVAAAFLGPRPEGWTVNHRNGNKRDNRASNLEYKTNQGNIQHAHALGLYPRGEQKANAKLTRKKVKLAMKMRAAGATFAAIADVLRVALGTVQQIFTGKTWTHVTGLVCHRPVREALDVPASAVRWVQLSEAGIEAWASCSPSYEASTLGGVRRKDSGRQLKPAPIANTGYLKVSLSEGGIVVTAAVHRLVAEAFLGVPPGYEVHHKDRDRANNYLCNLEIVTSAENAWQAANARR